MAEELKISIDIDEDGVGLLWSTHFDILRNHFSWPNEARNFASPRARKHIPKNEYLITKDGKFPIGIINEIWDYAKMLDPNITGSRFKVTSRARYYYEPSFLLPEKYDLYKFEDLPYRTIQEKALERVFQRGRGVVRVGTGGGKGLIMASICKTLHSYNAGQTIAILVPTHLIHKTYEEFVTEYGFTEDEISMWASKVEPRLHTPIVIFGPNYAVANEDIFDQHIINRNVLMVDESHIIKADSKITKLVKKMKTNNKIGFTGTLPDKAKDKWSVLGNIGKVVIDVSSKKLKELGYKSKSRVFGIKLKGCNYKPLSSIVDADGKKIIFSHKQKYDNEMHYLLTSPERTAFIKKWIMKVCKGNTLIPLDRNYHEDLLREVFNGCGRKVVFINGDTPKEDRTKIYNQMENEKNTLLFVKTSIMREGISIKKLDDIVMFFGQKAYIRILQLVGRIERLGSKTIPTVYDFYDDTKYSERHFIKRKAIYEEDGIPVKIKEVELEY